MLQKWNIWRAIFNKVLVQVDQALVIVEFAMNPKYKLKKRMHLFQMPMANMLMVKSKV
jgi:hypothetical protein